MPFPVDVQWIRETERKLSVQFPASFVSTMTLMNGGSVDVGIDRFELYPFLDPSSRKRLIRSADSLCRATQWNRKWEHFPQNLVVIGHNGGGDLLVLNPSGQDSTDLEDTIYFYDHETSELTPVADDFSDLVVSHS